MNGARGSVVGWGTTLQAERSQLPDEVIGCFSWPDPSSRTVALGSTQSLNRNEYQESSWRKGRPARKTDNLTAIC
jgi:hypothetical protein